MPSTNKILIFTEHSATREMVEASLAAGVPGTLIHCRTLAELAGYLPNGDAALVLVDLDSHGPGEMDELENIVDTHPRCRFIVLTSQRTPQLIQRAMQSGIRHVQLKSEIHEELAPVARTLLGSMGKEISGHGQVVTVLSAGGGSGATTVALNLAFTLLTRCGGRVLLVDGDLYYGSVGAYLSIENRYGLSEILNHENSPDKVLIQSTVAHYPGGLEVLLGPDATGPGRGGIPRPGNFAVLLEVCRNVYAMTVLDLPRPTGELLSAAAHGGGPLLIVMQPTVRDFRTAFGLFGLLNERGVGRARIVLVVNRFDGRRSAIPIKEIMKAFNGASVVCLRNDYANAARAATEGKPLLLRFPRSPLARDVAQLAQVLLDLNHAPRGETQEHAYVH